MDETLTSTKFSEQGEEGIGDGNVGIGDGPGRSISGGRSCGEGDAAEVFGRVQACGPAESGRLHEARRDRRPVAPGGVAFLQSGDLATASGEGRTVGALPPGTGAGPQGEDPASPAGATARAAQKPVCRRRCAARSPGGAPKKSLG